MALGQNEGLISVPTGRFPEGVRWATLLSSQCGYFHKRGST